jgi:soluble lytic murein transglycosylase-like protein
LDLVRGLIIAASAAAMGVGGTSAGAQAVAQFDHGTTTRLQALQPFIDEASDRFGVPDAWIRAAISAESGGRRSSPILAG